MAHSRTCLAMLCLPAALVLADGAVAQGTAPEPHVASHPAAAPPAV